MPENDPINTNEWLRRLQHTYAGTTQWNHLGELSPAAAAEAPWAAPDPGHPATTVELWLPWLDSSRDQLGVYITRVPRPQQGITETHVHDGGETLSAPSLAGYRTDPDSAIGRLLAANPELHRTDHDWLTYDSGAGDLGDNPETIMRAALALAQAISACHNVRQLYQAVGETLHPNLIIQPEHPAN